MMADATAPLAEADARRLLDAAREAMAHALPSASAFPVGAALLDADGTIHTGCNVESPSLLQVFCAERVALLKALSEGRRRFTHLAVVAEKRAPIPPCGLCRQMLAEFAPDVAIVTENETGAVIQRPLSDYLPFAFRL